MLPRSFQIPKLTYKKFANNNKFKLIQVKTCSNTKEKQKMKTQQKQKSNSIYTAAGGRQEQFRGRLITAVNAESKVRCFFPVDGERNRSFPPKQLNNRLGVWRVSMVAWATWEVSRRSTMLGWRGLASWVWRLLWHWLLFGWLWTRLFWINGEIKRETRLRN